MHSSSHPATPSLDILLSLSIQSLMDTVLYEKLGCAEYLSAEETNISTFKTYMNIFILPE